MSLDTVVDLTITKETTAPTRAGFGTPIIVAYHTAWSDRVREYAKPDDLLEDGFSTTSPVYKIAQAIKSQNPSPRRFKVGRRAISYIQTIHLIPRVTIVGFVYSGVIKGQAFSYTVQTGDDVEAIVSGLQAVINPLAGVTASDQSTHVSVAAAAGVFFDVKVGSGLDILDATIKAKTVHLTPTVTTEGHEYTVAAFGGPPDVLYTVQAGDTVADITAALSALGSDPFIEAIGLSITDAGTHLVMSGPTSLVDALEWGAGITVTVPDPTQTLTEDLAAIEEEDSDWFAMVLDSQSKDQILEAAAWIETKKKILVVQSADWDVKNADQIADVASLLKSLSYANTIGIFHGAIGEWAAAAWAGLMLTYAPGAATWAFKTLAGVPVSTLTTGEKSAIEGKNWSHYTTIGGKNVTFESKVGDGDYIDVTVFLHWLYARIRERVFGILSTGPKVPYTQSGIDLIAGGVRAVLKQGVDVGGLDGGDGSVANPGPRVDAPLLAEIDSADRANRFLPDIEFDARLAGAIHKTRISGTVSV